MGQSRIHRASVGSLCRNIALLRIVRSFPVILTAFVDGWASLPVTSWPFFVHFLRRQERVPPARLALHAATMPGQAATIAGKNVGKDPPLPPTARCAYPATAGRGAPFLCKCHVMTRLSRVVIVSHIDRMSRCRRCRAGCLHTARGSAERRPRYPICAWVVISHLLMGSLVAESPRPNVILLMADDLGYGDVGFQGNQIIRTPHLDAMAAGGLVFQRFYAAAPVCSPTRASCLTGRNGMRCGVPDANTGCLDAGEVTIAETLRELGYRTGHFGKWHLGTLTNTSRDGNRGRVGNHRDFSPPQQHGFERCFSTEAKVPTFDPMWKPRGAVSPLGWSAIRDERDARPFGSSYWNEQGVAVTENLRGDDSRVIMDRVIPFVRDAVARQQPFLAIVWFHAPHLPVVAGPRYATLYQVYPEYVRNYFGCVTAMDEQIGRLRSELRALGVAEHTLVAMTSDNGPEGDALAPGSTGGLRGRKRDLYEGGIRVPAIFEWPQRIRPGVTSFPAVTSDYVPTVLDLVGAAPAADRPLDGWSLVPLFDGNSPGDQRAIVFQYRRQLAVCESRFKLISQNGGQTWELYDLNTDRSEREQPCGQPS